MSILPSSPNASEFVPSSIKSFGAAVAVQRSRYGIFFMNSVTTVLRLPSKFFIAELSSQTPPMNFELSKW